MAGGESPHRRRRLLLGAVVIAVSVSAGGLGAATFVKSPQEVAAEAGPPKPSVITASVERRVLEKTVTLRGTVAPGRTIQVTPVSSGDAAKLVVSAPPLKVGTRIEAGRVIAVISGRPIIALRGKVPAYRDLRDGFQGQDVEQVQNALRDLGYGISDANGTYGPSTQAAVKQMYVSRGFQPVLEKEAPRATKSEQKKDTAKPREMVVLPSGEIQFVSKFPARVTEVKAKLGDEANGVILKIATGDLEVVGTLSATDRKLIRAGKRVEIFSEESGTSVKGRVTGVGSFNNGESESEGGEGGNTGMQAEPGYPIVVRGVRPLSEKLAGQDVRLTIYAASTDGSVLVVPVSAIYAVADGSTQVVKISENGKQTRLKVTTGATGGGFVEVSGTGLSEGNRVIVGGVR